MLKNADCTVYEYDTFKRHSIKGVYWNDSRGQTLAKNGAQISDSILVYIYSEEYMPKPKDLIIRGDCSFEFDSSTEKATAESMAEFRKAHPDFAIVKNVGDFRFGGLPHIEITAR